MPHQGITIFILFFGVSLLDALWGGHWLRAGFWLVMGAAFWGMDRWGKMREQRKGAGPHTGA